MNQLPTNPDAPRPAKPVRILIVEDEQIIAINLRESLESLGYVVPAIAATAEKAIERATELRPNLVLMDIRLKGAMDGIQAAEQIWNTLQIPVIYVTGHSDQSTLERAKVTAPFGYLLKPIKEKEIYVAIETALQRYEREQLLAAVFRGMGDGVIVADTQHRVKFLNRVAERLTGWSQEAARNLALSEVFNIHREQATPSMIDDLISLALQRDTPLYLDSPLFLTSQAGQTLPIADSITSIRDNDGQVSGVVIVFRDITQRLLAEERNLAVERARQLELQMEELQRLNQLKEDFLATVSHELRTPLSNIQLATRMLSIILDQLGILSQDTGSGSGSLSRYINILREQSEQELSFVNDLLDMQQLNAEVYPLDLSIVQLQSWLPHILEPFLARACPEGHQFQIEVPADLPSLSTDTHILTRILSELLTNACKYTPAQGQISITARVIEGGESWSLRTCIGIEVCNSGVEITDEERDRIFEPFYRIPQQDRWAKTGTGLGLALVRKFVAHLGGTVQVRSSADKTCFLVCLPLSLLGEET